MKVLVISYLFPNSQYPNYGIFVLNRLKALQRYCEIKVINPIPWFPYSSQLTRYRNFDRIPKRETIQGVEIFHPRFPIIPRYLKFFDSLSYLLAILPLAVKIRNYFPFDIIDLHWTYPDLPSGAVLSKITGKPFLTTIRGHEAFYQEEPGIRKKIVKYFLGKSSALISLSRKLKDVTIIQGCDENKVTVIRNGVDQKEFKLIKQSEAKKYLGIPSGRKVLLVVGSLIHGKGIDRIVASLKSVVEQHPAVHLYVVGSEGAAGFYKNALLNQIREQHLQQQISFVGEVKNSELLYWYNAADLFCLASRREGSPNVLTEALCCGCPSVATDVGSVREIMSEEYLGFVVPNQDDLLSGLLAGLEGTFDRRKISNHMRQYDWDWCARQVVAVYEQVAGEEQK